MQRGKNEVVIISQIHSLTDKVTQADIRTIGCVYLVHANPSPFLQVQP